MGFLDSLKEMAGQQMQGEAGSNEQGNMAGDNEQGRVAGGLVQAIQEHPGGFQGMLETMKQNGLEQHVQGWASGQNQTATSEQVEQGLGGTGVIASVAEKAGVSPQVAQMAIAALLPMVISHFAPNGQAAPQSQFGGLASQLLSRFL